MVFNMKVLIYLFQCVLLVAITSEARPSFDNCDYYGSGTMELALSRGVQPVYLRCNQGIIRWSYPQGGLRVVLQHRTAGIPFAACIRRSKESSGARIFLAGKKKLHPIFKSEDPMDLVRCVASQEGQVTLYVEADPIADVLRRPTAGFGYHLKTAVPSKEEFPEECQPCTESELLHQYCSSDFVFQGSVSSLFHNKALQVTELSVRVSKTHRANESNRFAKLSNNSVEESAEPIQHVVLHRPLKCGTKAGLGEYLFLGKWVLGNPNLNCIPRVSEWKKVRRKALKTGINECLLNL